jgi:hypothetical protein
MFKLKKLQEEKAAKEKEDREKAEAAKAAGAALAPPGSPSSSDAPFMLQKTKSSEIADIRKKKSQENVLSLRSKGWPAVRAALADGSAGGGVKKKAQQVSAAELRAQKGTSSETVHLLAGCSRSGCRRRGACFASGHRVHLPRP